MVSRMIVPSNEITALLSCVFLLLRLFIVCHRLFAPVPNSHFSRYALHFVRMWSLTIFLIFDDSVLILVSSGLVARNASRSTASLDASMGNFVLISGIYPAGIYLLAAYFIFFRSFSRFYGNLLISFLRYFLKLAIGLAIVMFGELLTVGVILVGIPHSVPHS